MISAIFFKLSFYKLGNKLRVLLKAVQKGKSANTEFSEWDETNLRVCFLFLVLFLENLIRCLE